MQRELEGRTALVTGGAIGIGRAIASELAARGAHVAITYRTHAPDDDLKRQLGNAAGRDALRFRVDATDEGSVSAVAAELTAELGSLDILVNNVGGLVERSSIRDMSPALWRKVIAVNLDSLFLMTHHCLPLLAAEGGRIINVASLAGRNGGHAGATAYATTKAGVFGFTRGLAKELAPLGTTVNALAPGFIENTPFHTTFTTAESKAETIGSIPAGRAGTPQDVAAAAAWLAGPSASFVNGAVIDINGAQYFG
jgi:3-oxoacyl-[acyl-carrier protein] reductase